MPSTVNLYYYRRVDKILGQRLREARALRAVTQEQLAARTVNTREAISMVERGRSGWALDKIAAAARALDVSSDFLLGLTDDLRPAAELARELDDGDYVGVSELASAAGDGAVVEQERVTGRVKFRRTWLARHGLVARDCRVIQVSGESMEPTLVDGCSILVNLAARRRRTGRIFVIRAADGLVVKRADKHPSGAWRIVSDNPNKHVWPTRSLAARRRDRRRGQVGREDIRVKEPTMTQIANQADAAAPKRRTRKAEPAKSAGRRRVRVAEGIYRDRHGLAATVKVNGVQREIRFPAGTPLKTIRAKRDELRASLRTVPAGRAAHPGSRCRAVSPPSERRTGEYCGPAAPHRSLDHELRPHPNPGTAPAHPRTQ